MCPKHEQRRPKETQISTDTSEILSHSLQDILPQNPAAVVRLCEAAGLSAIRRRIESERVGSIDGLSKGLSDLGASERSQQNQQITGIDIKSMKENERIESTIAESTVPPTILSHSITSPPLLSSPPMVVPDISPIPFTPDLHKTEPIPSIAPLSIAPLSDDVDQFSLLSCSNGQTCTTSDALCLCDVLSALSYEQIQWEG